MREKDLCSVPPQVKSRAHNTLYDVMVGNYIRSSLAMFTDRSRVVCSAPSPHIHPSVSAAVTFQDKGLSAVSAPFPYKLLHCARMEKLDNPTWSY